MLSALLALLRAEIDSGGAFPRAYHRPTVKRRIFGEVNAAPPERPARPVGR
jgi:hypothetical protein